ncbi:MAG TPA: hypothetical protein DEB39_14485 [Planctomycetaceae bacterium]|nr:hypothetical protein [Planctomycetaceae bacterium]
MAVLRWMLRLMKSPSVGGRFQGLATLKTAWKRLQDFYGVRKRDMNLQIRTNIMVFSHKFSSNSSPVL